MKKQSNSLGVARKLGLTLNRARLLGCLITFLTMGASARLKAEEAGAVTLKWDATSDTNVVNYKVYYGGASGDYVRSLDTGRATSVRVTGLIANFTYYFTVTASDAAGIESVGAAELLYTVPASPSLGISYVASSNLPPVLPASPEFAAGAFTADGKFRFTVFSPRLDAVSISASSDLSTWETLGVIVNPTGGLTVTDLSSTPFSHRYYRFEPVDTSELGTSD